MDAPRRTRRSNRDRSHRGWQVQRGSRQIVIPMTREQYDGCWHDPQLMREFVDRMLVGSSELFPAGMREGYAFHGFGRPSKKLAGVRLRKVRLSDRTAYHLRPSFVMGYMTGTVENLWYPLLLASYGVPPWLLKVGFGHSDMFWHRLLERLGCSSLVGATVRDPARLPEHLAADEHHVDWSGEKGYIATAAAEGCVLGVALTKAADDAHLAEAYGVFAEEARNVRRDYAPKTVNTDGWAPTQNAFRTLFSTIAVVLCFLHGFLKIRERCRKQDDLHRRVWDVYRAKTAEEFRRLMEAFHAWCDNRTWPASVREMLTKLWNKTDEYAVAYEHPGCSRTSNTVDRPMNRLCRLMYAGRGLHGNQSSSERRLRGWALLLNFRPYAPRSGQAREYSSPAHHLNRKRYHEHWLHNLQASTSLLGRHQTAPAIR